MLLKTLFGLLLLLPSICEGFDFEYQKSSDNGVCGMATCTDMVGESAEDTRKIISLTVYKKSSGSKKWNRLAKLSKKSPTHNEATDDMDIEGKFSKTEALLELKLRKPKDCKSVRLACEVELKDSSGRISTLKAVVAAKKAPKEDSQSAGLSGKQAGKIITKIDDVITALKEKIADLETRLEDSSERDDRLEDKLETLNEEISGLDRNVSRDITSSGDQMGNKMDMVNDRLMEKLTEVIARIPSPDADSNCLNEVCASISSQLSVVGNSVESLNGNVNSLGDEVRGVKGSVPSSTELNNKLDKMASTVDGDGRPRLLRRFFMSHQYGGCANDKGWFVAADAVPGGCLWEKKEKAPAFFYSKGDHLAWWKHLDQFARADAMGIFVMYK
ncbi:hypothetical protein ElyMa_004825700 [Elysia marginata]|uniref:C-type lectin domain-containing protein n=1 Tax=Elysia marginata TaxID=1093978 RepID=A0AAV4IKH3_9GAST|nr:hypothetical protein ElyMa_004825700 [Elysia marginata]